MDWKFRSVAIALEWYAWTTSTRFDVRRLFAMLNFVVGLQSPEVSGDWSKVEALCRRTLQSLAGQTCDDFRIVLVCNKAPRGLESIRHLEVIEENFPAPGHGGPTRMGDKWAKVGRGLEQLRDRLPGHVMICDADDCVSNRLAALCRENPEANGYLIQKGYLHSEGSRWLLSEYDFSRVCGTSSIVRLEKHDLPERGDETKRCFVLEQGHTRIGDYMASVGRPLQGLPFFGAIYCMATGENDGGRSIRNLRSGRDMLKTAAGIRHLGSKKRREFGFYPI
jgi:hypothetical protein